ncbi:DUF1311 domain-containing protein [Pseudomonas sp. NFXW11]|uniref:lysozyme inhibitor LprI family protein n=1 Tax=Pseudomonas sp. NFXW11 TaxID=2819531 RepID=UPI003CFAAAD7
MFIPSRRVWPASALLLATLACTPGVQASSFDCSKATTQSEQAICADPYTAGLDAQLAQAWSLALGQSKAPKALRQDQRQWLQQREQCAANLACLRGSYLSRLIELRYVNQPFNWPGTWQRMSLSPFYAGELVIRSLGGERLDFEISGMGGANSGALQGEAQLKGEQASYAAEGCRLTFKRQQAFIEVSQEGESYDCGAGMGVSYAGRYVPSKRELELHYDLLSSALVRTEDEDRQARQLLGADYQALLDSGSLFTAENSADLPDAEVTELWLRGAANTNAAIFVRGAQGQLWVALLVLVDDTDDVRVRYYTTVPEWRQSLPDVVQNWYEARIKGKISRPALDMMP